MAFVLALDQGTTSSRALVFDHRGAVRGMARQELRQIYPEPGWVEHDPTEIWATQSGVMHEALAKADITGRDVAAIGITNQRETTLLWERATGRPLANAIVWQDRRTAPMCDALRAAGHEAALAAKTGLVLDAYFSGTKLKWLLDHLPGARVRAERGELAFGTIDTWLVWKLTNGAVHVTDASNASRTLLYDIHTGTWDDELLALFDVPREVLPRVVSSSEVIALAALGGAAGAEVPIAGIAGDQQAALFGQACDRPGLAKNTYGTGCFLLLNTGGHAVPSKNRLLTTVAWDLGGALTYALEGSVFVGGAAVQWLRDGLKLIRTAADVEALAASETDNGGVYMVPAFAGLGAPHWDPYARGAVFGLTRGSTGGHLARAVLESIAFQSADVLYAMEKDAGVTLTELRVDGGATANELLMQFQADLLGVPVVRPEVLETTALGAAYLFGVPPIADGEAGEIRGAEGGRLEDLGPDDGHAEEIGLELHEELVRGGAAVDAQLGQRDAGVLLHGVEDVGALEGDRLEDRAREMSAGRAAGEPKDGAPRVGVPVRRAEPREGRHHVHAPVVGLARGERLDVGGRPDEFQPVPEPLHGGAPDEDAALEGVGEGAAEIPGDGREQAVFRGDRVPPGVEEQKTAGAVGVLREAGPVASLPEEGRLLIPRDARDRDLRSCRSAERRQSDHFRGGDDAGQDFSRNVEEREELVVPCPGVDVVKQRPACIRGVGHVHGPIRELPDEPRVDRAEGELAPLRANTRPRQVVEQPLQLRAGKIGVEDEAGLRGERRLVAGRAERVAHRRGSSVLPDDRVRERTPRRALPEERRLALVRDADGRDVAARDARLRERLVHHARLRRPDFRRIVLDPAGLGIDLPELLPGHAAHGAAVVEDERARTGRTLIEGEDERHGRHGSCRTAPLARCATIATLGRPPGRSSRRPQPRTGRRRVARRGAASRPRGRGLGEDARPHPPARAGRRAWRAAGRRRRGHLHKQGRGRDERPRRRAPRHGAAALVRRDVSRVGRAPSQALSGRGGSAEGLRRLRLRRPARRREARHEGSRPAREVGHAAPDPVADLAGQERGDPARRLPAPFRRLFGIASRRHFPRVRESAAGFQGSRLRRSPHPVDATRGHAGRRARVAAEEHPASPRGRISGHEPRPGEARAAHRGEGRKSLRRRRRGPVHLPLARCGRVEHPGVHARLPDGEDGPPRAELPLDGADPEGRERGRGREPPPPRQDAEGHEDGGREGASRRLRRGARRGEGDRLPDRRRAARAPGFRGGGVVPDERAVARLRGRAPALEHAVHPRGRDEVLRARRDQGRARIPAPRGEPGRRRVVPKGRQRAGAGHRRGHEGGGRGRRGRARRLAPRGARVPAPGSHRAREEGADRIPGARHEAARVRYRGGNRRRGRRGAHAGGDRSREALREFPRPAGRGAAREPRRAAGRRAGARARGLVRRRGGRPVRRRLPRRRDTPGRRRRRGRKEGHPPHHAPRGQGPRVRRRVPRGLRGRLASPRVVEGRRRPVRGGAPPRVCRDDPRERAPDALVRPPADGARRMDEPRAVAIPRGDSGKCSHSRRSDFWFRKGKLS